MRLGLDAQRPLRLPSLKAGEPGNKPDICKDQQGGDTQMRDAPGLLPCYRAVSTSLNARDIFSLNARPAWGEADLPCEERREELRLGERQMSSIRSIHLFA